MMALSLVLMLAADATVLSTYSLPPRKAPRCTGICARQYRVPSSSDGGDSVKDSALANDGSKCNVVGARRCTAKRYTILRSTEDPMDTWRAALGEN